MNAMRWTSRWLCLAVISAMAPMPCWAGLCGTLINPILVVPTAIAFSIYDPSSNIANHANGTINVACTVTALSNLPSFSIALNGGLKNQLNPRQMGLLTSTLGYNIYTSNAYSTIWGDGTSSTVTRSFTAGSAASTSFTAYGSIPPNEFATVGLYTDTVTVTVTF